MPSKNINLKIQFLVKYQNSVMQNENIYGQDQVHYLLSKIIDIPEYRRKWFCFSKDNFCFVICTYTARYLVI
jgi:hypothetical protein